MKPIPTANCVHKPGILKTAIIINKEIQEARPESKKKIVPKPFLEVI